MIDNHVRSLATDILIAMEGTECQYHGEICVQCMKDSAVSIRDKLITSGGTWEQKRWVIWLEGVTDRSTETLLHDSDCIGVVELLTGKRTTAVILELENARRRDAPARLKMRPPLESG